MTSCRRVDKAGNRSMPRNCPRRLCVAKSLVRPGITMTPHWLDRSKRSRKSLDVTGLDHPQPTERCGSRVALLTETNLPSQGIRKMGVALTRVHAEPQRSGDVVSARQPAAQ